MADYKLIAVMTLILCWTSSSQLELQTFNNTFAKYYIRNDTLQNDLLYLELTYRYYDDWETDFTINSSKFLNSFASYKIYWFLRTTTEYLGNFYFYGFAVSKQINGQIQHDLYICKMIQIYQLNKCNDYSMVSAVNQVDFNASKIFLEETFNPVLDTSNNGEDSIINSKLFDLITTNIYQYSTLLRLEIKTYYYSLEQYDLQFELNNTLTVFYGRLNMKQNFTKQISQNFEYSILDAASIKFADIFSSLVTSHMIGLNPNIACTGLMFLLFNF